MPSSPEARRGSQSKQWLLFLITSLISIGCLVWVLHDASLGELGHEIARLDWRWVAVAMISDVLAYVWQAWRWNLILTPVKPVSFGHSLRAIFVALFASEVLPLHASELIRCFLQARWNDLPLSVSLASALIERIFDGVWLIVCLFLTVRYVPNLPRGVVDGGYVLGVLILIAAALMAVAMFWKEQTLARLARVKWLGWVHILVKDLHLIGHSRYLYFAAIVSIPYLLTQVIPIYALMQAYHHLDQLNIFNAFVTLVILRLGTGPPQAPANLGGFQALTVLSLLLFHVHRGLAKRFSLVLWGVVTVPLLVCGFIALAITGVKMNELHREAKDSMNGQPQPVSGRRIG